MLHAGLPLARGRLEILGAPRRLAAKRRGTALPTVDSWHLGGSRSEHSSFEHGAIEGWSQQSSGTHTATPYRVQTGVDHRLVHENLGMPAPPCGPYPVAGLRGRFVVRSARFPPVLNWAEIRNSGLLIGRLGTR